MGTSYTNHHLAGMSETVPATSPEAAPAATQDGTFPHSTSEPGPSTSQLSSLPLAHSTGNPQQDDDNHNSDMDSDSDAEGVKRWIINPAPQPRQITAKRRADTALFEKWVEQNRHSLAKRTRGDVAEDGQSVLALMRDFENKKIITNPRDYQLELFERAKVQNTIAVLDTGKSCHGPSSRWASLG